MITTSVSQSVCCETWSQHRRRISCCLHIYHHCLSPVQFQWSSASLAMPQSDRRPPFPAHHPTIRLSHLKSMQSLQHSCQECPTGLLFSPLGRDCALYPGHVSFWTVDWGNHDMNIKFSFWSNVFDISKLNI